MTENSGGLLGKYEQFFRNILDIWSVSVFREYKPLPDTIEYTVYFYNANGKQRLDIEEKAETFMLLPNGATEGYMMGRVTEAIRNGKFTSVGEHE